MVRLTERRRAVLAEKFGDLANFAAAALVFGQAVSETSFSLGIGVAGISLWAVLMAAAYFLAGESK